MNEQKLIAVVTTNSSLINEGVPAFIAKDEKELEVISSELGRIFFADVNRLSNGIVIIKSAAR